VKCLQIVSLACYDVERRKYSFSETLYCESYVQISCRDREITYQNMYLYIIYITRTLCVNIFILDVS